MISHAMSNSDESDGEYIPLLRRLGASDVSAGSSLADPIRLDSSSSDQEHGAAAQSVSPAEQEAVRGNSPGRSPPAADAKLQRQQQRAAAKRQKLLEKQLRRAEAAVKRSARPEHCQKTVQAVVDRHVLEVSGGGQLLAALQEASDVSVHVTSAPQPGSVTWNRQVTDWREQDGQVVSTARQERQDQLVAVMEAQALAALVDRQEEAPFGGLAGAVMDLGRSTGMKVTVLCWGLDSLCRTKTLAGSYRQAATAAGGRARGGARLDRLQLEAAIVDTLLDTPHTLRLVGTPAEGGQFLAQMSKAIAEAPFKRQVSQQQFAWFADADSVRPVKLDRQLRGLRRLWTEQLRQLTGGSLEAAQAVSAAYPSPQALLRAYNACGSSTERERLVADLAVRRSAGPLVTSRRIGPETSRKLYLAMTATDGATEL